MIMNVKCVLYAWIYPNTCKPNTELTKTDINVFNDIQSTTIENPTISDLYDIIDKVDLSDLKNILSNSHVSRQKKYYLGLDKVDETSDKGITNKDDVKQVLFNNSETATLQLKNYLFSDLDKAHNFLEFLTRKFPRLSNLTIKNIQKPNEQDLVEILRIQKMLVLLNEIAILNIEHGLYDEKLRTMSYNYGNNIIERSDENPKVYKEFALKLRDITNELIYKKVVLATLYNEQLSFANRIK